ncbi:hypothetical protein J4455_02920 [Candidatus Woesearchaeota archaeon]|nr:hypothetical protein [Candidatus Woesearchaeota archaeon]
MKIKFMIISLFAILLVLPIAFAEYQLLCLNRGETVRFSMCNPSIPDRTCDSNSGCQYCTNNLGGGVYCPANINQCNSLGLSCSYLANASIDREAPIIDLNSPENNEVYNERVINIDIRINEIGDLYYQDNINGRDRWTRLCTDCSSYLGRRSFKEGLNNITFKANDPEGNTNYLNISFYVDSIKPKIIKTEPKRGLTSGNFMIQFREENPESLMIHYGNPINGYLMHEVNLNDCQENRGKHTCNTNINLNLFNGQIIEYWAHLIDISDSSHETRRVSISVDTQMPVIEALNYEIDGRNVDFDILINEANFDSLDYYDHNESRPRWRTLCSRLRDNHCIARKSFIEGIHNIDLQVIDKAGNTVAQSTSFTI